MKATVVERRAELLRLYTGLGWKTALARVEAAEPGSVLIPEPDAGQLVLEARVMAALAWRKITTLHPWGIEYVDPRSDRLLIRFEPDVVGRRDAEATQALDLAKALLPRVDEYGQITGVAGARTHVEHGNVLLRLLGTTASVVLLGLDPEEWRRAVETQDQEMSTWGMTPCHQGRPDSLHPAERPYRRPGRRGVAASDWLTSGLLRRAGLVRSLGVPLAVTGWLNFRAREGGERWIIDPTFAEGHGPAGHRRLAALLSARGWGLPVTVVDEDCNCHLPPGYTDQCTTTVSSLRPEWPGTLEVRTIHRRGDRLRRIQQDQTALYAAQKELTHSVPASVDRWLASVGSPTADESAERRR
ncbi:hypothetical protein [Streptomyces sp. SPB4]|uniref:hypothetical protein n=1 Tax=Streptomyces sp. SPB4 TaxID=2940553 RepID=UPI0024741001|nr:hypothetical protein [Streptomyces sp. SPB4]MDH6545221.1 hypothetical protein [Streptomyces sp. SPB4]